MVTRYANKGQWRGYCVDEKTQALTQRGWLGIDDIDQTDQILSCNDGQLAWSSIQGIYRTEYSGNMFHLTVQGLDALVTPGHKFLTHEGLKPVEHLREKDQITLLGRAISSPTGTYDDAFVELIGWVVTEGNFYRDPARTYCRVTIYQNEGIKADRIRNALSNLGAHYGEYHSGNAHGKKLICFHLRKDICNRIAAVVPDKRPTMTFINSLSLQQRGLLIDTMVAADGWVSYDKYRNYGQCDKDHIDVFVALCTMAGYRTSVKLHDPVGYGKKPFYKVRIFSNTDHKTMIENVDFHGGKNTHRHIGQSKETYPNEPTVPYNGRVWCPQTEFGTFVARRNGYIYLTGNSYIDDMKSDALLTLCQNAFKYNEEKYDNPFGYYTQIIKYCFITFLEKEEIIRDIKDSLWESIGMTPSYARQIKNEMLRDVGDTSTKGLKLLKKDVDALQIKIDTLSQLGSKITKLREPDLDIDFEIAELLGLELLPYTGNIQATLLLFFQQPRYQIDEGIEVAGQIVNCLSVHDESTQSQTKRIITDVSEKIVTIALCSIGIAVRRDLMVKRLREISGFNLTPRFPVSEERTDNVEPEPTFTDYPPPEAKPRRKRPA